MRRRLSADSWSALQLEYAAYHKRPTWNHWKHPPNARGGVTQSSATHMLEKGARAEERLAEAFQRLKGDPHFPKQPIGVSQKYIDRIIRDRLLPTRLLHTFWSALVFHRDRYTCRYCGRSARSVWRESGERRSISLLVDHRKPRLKRGADFTFENSFTACWTCNGMKATWPAKAFRLELESLAKAVLISMRAAGRR